MKNQALTLRHILITLIILLLSTLLSFALFLIIPDNIMNIALIYTLGSVMIARYTKGYQYDVLASIISVICINFFFTYPHFEINFTITGYPLTFITMLAITLSTSALTSHMKKQAEILAVKEKELMEADKEKMRANLLRAVSHDLRTPLTSIMGAVSELTEEDKSLSKAERKEIQQHIYDDANWLRNMVENLLTVTRIQNDTSTVKKNSEVVEEVVEEAVTRLRKRLPHAKINVSTPEEFLMIPMDAMLIEQVLINLIENAVIHSHSQEPVEVTITTDTDNVIFTITDYGIGIAKEKLASIFDASATTNTNSSDSQKGMGIGLTICKTIIQVHNGSIMAQNHKGGAQFIFTLPKEEDPIL